MNPRAVPLERVLVFTLERERFALPLSSVERVVQAVAVTPLPGAPELVMGLIDVHGEIAPVMNLRRRLGFADCEVQLEDCFILARSHGRLVALVADAVTGLIELAADEIVDPAAVAPHSSLIHGVLKLSDGLVLLQDLEEFLSLEESQRLDDALATLEIEARSSATPKAR